MLYIMDRSEEGQHGELLSLSTIVLTPPRSRLLQNLVPRSFVPGDLDVSIPYGLPYNELAMNNFILFRLSQERPPVFPSAEERVQNAMESMIEETTSYFDVVSSFILKGGGDLSLIRDLNVLLRRLKAKASRLGVEEAWENSLARQVSFLSTDKHAATQSLYFWSPEVRALTMNVMVDTLFADISALTESVISDYQDVSVTRRFDSYRRAVNHLVQQVRLTKSALDKRDKFKEFTMRVFNVLANELGVQVTAEIMQAFASKGSVSLMNVTPHVTSALLDSPSFITHVKEIGSFSQEMELDRRQIAITSKQELSPATVEHILNWLEEDKTQELMFTSTPNNEKRLLYPIGFLFLDDAWMEQPLAGTRY